MLCIEKGRLDGLDSAFVIAEKTGCSPALAGMNQGDAAYAIMT